MCQRNTHHKVYWGLSGKARSRPFKSSEVKDTLILTTQQTCLFKVPPTPALVLLKVTSDSWLSLDVWYELHYCCVFHVDRSRNTHPKLRGRPWVGVGGEGAQAHFGCRGPWSSRTSTERETVLLTLQRKVDQLKLRDGCHDKDENTKPWL